MNAPPADHRHGHSDFLPPCPLPLQGRHVLIVEDAPDQQRLYTRLLEHAGAKVTLECNGEAALNAVLRSRQPIDAVVMDLAMPVMDGIEATRRLRRNGYTVPVIAVTAYDREGVEAKWYRAGCNAYLTKPVAAATLVTTVRLLASGAICLRRPPIRKNCVAATLGRVRDLVLGRCLLLW